MDQEGRKQASKQPHLTSTIRVTENPEAESTHGETVLTCLCAGLTMTGVATLFLLEVSSGSHGLRRKGPCLLYLDIVATTNMPLASEVRWSRLQCDGPETPESLSGTLWGVEPPQPPPHSSSIQKVFQAMSRGGHWSVGPTCSPGTPRGPSLS